MRRARCRDCGAPVLFVRMEPSGRLMPVDPDVDPAGTVAAMRDVSGNLAGDFAAAGTPAPPGHRRYVTHFATCRARRAESTARTVEAAHAAGASNVVPLFGPRRGR